MKNYNRIRAEDNELQRLQEFKIPFTNFVNGVIYGDTTPIHEDLCEFYLLQDSDEEFENRDLEIEIEETAKKLARLLELKEQVLKSAIIMMM